MFDRIAFRYDLMNRFLSAGIDVHWRKMAIRELQSDHPALVLDVATGTADMPILMTKYLQTRQIIGVDISEGMLELGRKKIDRLKLTEKIELRSADSEALPFAGETFDAVTVAFGVRNFENLEQGLQEMRRVLKTGGKLIILEFSKPGHIGFKNLYNIYLRFIAPFLGKLLSKNKAAYQYLNESVRAFPEGNDLLRILEQVGYNGTYLKSLSAGICTIYCGNK